MFFGFENEIDENFINNIEVQEEKLRIVPIEIVKTYLKNALEFKAGNLYSGLEKFVSDAMEMLFIKYYKPLKPTRYFKQIVWKEFELGMAGDKYLASDKDVKYSQERQTQILFDVLKKYLP